MGDAFGAEEDELVGDVAGGVRLVEDGGAGAVPVELDAVFLDAIAVAVVGVVGGFAGEGCRVKALRWRAATGGVGLRRREGIVGEGGIAGGDLAGP